MGSALAGSCRAVALVGAVAMSLVCAPAGAARATTSDASQGGAAAGTAPGSQPDSPAASPSPDSASTPPASAPAPASEPATASAAESAPAPAAPSPEPGSAPAAPEPPGLELPPVEVVAPPSPQPSVPEEPTASGTVVERSDFAGESLQVADLLLHAPGTMVRRAPGMETLQVRGASPDQSLVLLDGIRLNSLGGGGVDLRTLPAGLIERITLIRGNEGARYGAGALGGVALLQTRSLDRFAPSVAIHSGSFGTMGIDGSIGAGDGTTQGLAGLSLDTTRGDFVVLHDDTSATPGGERAVRIENNDQSLGALLLTGRTRTGATRIDALALGSFASRGLPGTVINSSHMRRDTRRGLLALRAERPAGAATLRGSLELRREEVALSGPSTGIAGGPSGWQRETQLGAQAGAEVPLGDSVRVFGSASAGVDMLDSPRHGTPSRGDASLQLAPELDLGRTVTLAPAARFDVVGPYTSLSPRFGAAWRPISLLELRGNAGLGFRAPSFGELYFELGPVHANQDLRPERGYSVDGGAVLRLRGFTAQVSAFFARTTDQITYEVQSGLYSKPVNFLDAATTGGELEAVWQPARGVTASGSWTRARTKNLHDDPRFLNMDLPFHPRDRVLVRLAGRTGMVEAFAEGSWQSAQFTSRDNKGGQLPEQLSARTGAGFRVLRSPYEVWLSGEVDNLTDERLFDQLGFYQPGRAFFFTLRAAPPGTGDS
jgi:iron complex outermembrane receptor protein